MRVLKVIHGYPPAYSAGSEVYTQALVQGLVRQGHKVAVFSRREDPFLPDFEMTRMPDPSESGVDRFLVNLPNSRDRYSHSSVDDCFESVLGEFKPDVVHVGHLNHLSTSLIQRAYGRGIPVVFTLHDYWLMCPRGQFVQTNVGSGAWALCDGQEDRKCATHCYTRYYTGLREAQPADVEYWTGWVGERMEHVRQMVAKVSLFIAPSEYLRRRFVDEFGLPKDKVVYLDYGFDTARLSGRTRATEEDFVFGYIGTHTVPKGINLLIEAFGKVEGKARLRIWGKANPLVTPALKEIADALPPAKRARVEWLGEYQNPDIVRRVLNRVDAIVVPSIWVENSPLVIHEAQQARVSVIAADLGGMAEYVKEGENGLLFRPRDSADLARQMRRLAEDPRLAHRLGQRGYIKSPDGNVPSLERHVLQVAELYRTALESKPLVPS